MIKKGEFSLYNLSKYRNVLMGLQILLILVFHFTEDCKVHDIRYDGWIYIFYNYIRSSGVDGFLFLSGLGLFFSLKKQPNRKVFYQKRWTKLFIPYTIVAIPVWFCIDMVIKKESFFSFLIDFFFLSFFQNGQKLFWYVFMIAFCYLIFPYLFEVFEQASDQVTEYLRTIVLCLTVIVFTVMLQLYHNDLYQNISIALTRFPAFFIGIAVGKSTYEKRNMSIYIPFVMLGVSVLLLGPLEFYNKTIFGMITRGVLNISICLVLVVLLSLIDKKNGRIINSLTKLFTNILGWFGKYTFELYLVHISIRRLMNTTGFKTYRLSYECLMIVLSVIISIILNKLVNKKSIVLNKAK